MTRDKPKLTQVTRCKNT